MSLASMKPLTAKSLRAYERSPINAFTGKPNSAEFFALLDRRDAVAPERRPAALNRILDHLGLHQHVVFGGKTSLSLAAQITQFVYWQIHPLIRHYEHVGQTFGQRKILIVTPTRSFATGLASILKRELGTSLAQDILTRMREGDRHHHSRITVATEGMALRAIMDDCTMSGYGAMIFMLDDPSSTLELMMAWSCYIRSKSTDIRFIFLSPPTDYQALLSTHSLSFPCLLEITSSSVQPVIRYDITTRRDQPRWVVEEVIHYLRMGLPGDILVYAPGYREAQKVAESIRRDPAMGVYPAVEIHLISADVEEENKNRAIGHRTVSIPRRLILTTHILPAPDVNIILDNLIQRSANYDPYLNRDAVSLSRISASQADQRIRGAGCVSRCVTEDEWRMIGRERPEAIPRVKTEDYQELLLYNLALTVKLGKKFATPEGNKVLPTANQPSLATMLRAVDTLESVGAIDVNDETGEFRISHMGAKLADLPVLVEYGKALMASRELGVSSEMIILVTAVSTSKPLLLPRPKLPSVKHVNAVWDRRDALELGAGDHLDCYNAFREFRRLCEMRQQGETLMDIAKRLGLNYQACRKALSICGSLRYRMRIDYDSDYYAPADKEAWDPRFIPSLQRGAHDPSVIERIQRALLAGHLGKVAILLNERAWAANTAPVGTPNVPLDRRREVTHMRWRDRSTTLIVKPFSTSAPIHTAAQVIYTSASLDHSTGLTAIRMITPFQREWLDEECMRRTNERFNP